MRSEDGYTLAETLAALVMVGLAVGGLVAGVDQLGRMQSKAGVDAERANRQARLNIGLSRFLENAGPFRSDDPKGLSGDSDHFTFVCGEASCGAELTRRNGAFNLVLTGRDGMPLAYPTGADGELAFAYDDDEGEGRGWPPSDAQQPRTLRAVSIVRPRLGEDLPVATVRVFAEQPAACAFDPISRTCRPEAAP